MAGAPLIAPGAIERVYRNEAGRVLATLIRLVGDFELAEEGLQDAFRASGRSLLALCVCERVGSPRRMKLVAAEYGGPVTTLIFDDGVHIVNNVWYKARPAVADWLSDTL